MFDDSIEVFVGGRLCSGLGFWWLRVQVRGWFRTVLGMRRRCVRTSVNEFFN